jgi:V8-like Glu-specific endopeptidase
MSVIGNDDRVLVTTFDAPWKFVGRWSILTPGSEGVASGVLIGSEYVLTAQHVLYPMLDGPRCLCTSVFVQQRGCS